MQRLSLCVVICFFMLSGCSSNSMNKNPIFQESNKIMELVDDSQWETADKAAQVIQKMYKKNKWKYQLLGDESEYNGLQQEISKLKISINEKDKPEAKRSIVIIQEHIQAIYQH